MSDFGIAHITGGFTTATGTFTGSPAFIAPEILSGDPPSRSSDVYGIGATLFCALTGHAAFERRSGEQMVAQFLRIASESAPDLRESGIPDDVCAVVEKAMARDPHHRPSAQELGVEIQQLQTRHGLPVDDMALRAEPDGESRPRAATTGAHHTIGNLPLELTSFVGRRTELSEVRNMLAASRMVTLAGMGGVGKTRLALRAAGAARPDFRDGVWLVELGELHDGSLLLYTVAAALGVRDESALPLRDVLVEFLAPRRLLLVLDNCEQVVESAAELAEALLRACPEVRVLTTSREALGIGGEAVLRLPPLEFPDADREPTLGGLPGYDAVALFADRAAAAVPGFELTDDNKATVARICSKLDGLPLAIELAAARLRVISPEQILERLADRYTLLTRGSRGAPTRQQTLGWSVGWSYDLCTPIEQQLWGRLSVFAGGFELEAAESICAEDLSPDELLDGLSSLVDKSILIRTESKGVVRFRLLETLREYGRQQITQTNRYQLLRRRHADWYRRLVADATADWFSPRQVYWLQRVERERANIRAALESSLTDSPETALEIAGTIHPFGLARGAHTETRRWLDRALDGTPPEPTRERIGALYGSVLLAGLQGDLPAATARVAEGRMLVEQMTDSEAHGMVTMADGLTALVSGEFDGACSRFEEALDAVDDPTLRVSAMLLLGWGLEFGGELGRALIWQEKALAFAESSGESVYRGYALWSLGVGWWQNGKPDNAEQLLTDALQVSQLVNDPRQASACLEALAWIADAKQDPRRAATLIAAAAGLGRSVGASTVVLPHLLVFHDACERSAREALGAKEFEAAQREGSALSFDEAVAYAATDA